MYAALRSTVVLETHELGNIRSLLKPQNATDEFVITLDNGTYFSKFDYDFSMTRAHMKLHTIYDSTSIRIAREGYGAFWSQVAALRSKFENTEQARVIICDDGIDSGKSLRELIECLKEQGILIREIRTYLNTHGISEIENVPVVSTHTDTNFIWSHERDLFWGTPGGGVSVANSKNHNVIRGVPYTISNQLLRHRMGISGDVTQLRNSILDVNLEFWHLLSDAASRPIRLRDIPRLEWLTTLDRGFNQSTNILEVIGDIKDREISKAELR